MRYYTLLFILFITVRVAAQEVNTRFTFDYLANVATGVYDTDSVLYIKGIYTDSNYVYGTYWHTINKSTNETHHAEFVLGPGIITDSWKAGILPISNGHFIYAGYGIDKNTPDTFFMSAFIAEFTPEGSLVKQTVFNSPYKPIGKDFISPLKLKQMRNGDYLMLGSLDGNELQSALVLYLRLNSI